MQLAEVINEFGRYIGAKSLEMNENGVIHMTINKIGDLFIDAKYQDESREHIFIYLMRVYEHFDGDLYRRAMELCDYQPNQDYYANPVLHKDQVIGFVVKLHLDDFNLNALRAIVSYLKDLQDRLEQQKA